MSRAKVPIVQSTPSTNKNVQKQAPSTTKPVASKVAQQSSLSPDFDPSKYVRPGLSAEDIVRIKECFDIFDYNHNGSISPHELQNAIVALKLEKSAEEILNLITELDRDGNTDVDFDEFLQIFGLTGDINEEDVLRDLFSQFDSHANGHISVEDFKRINDLVGERYSEAELREMVEYADKDKDGFINWDEFHEVVTKEYQNV